MPASSPKSRRPRCAGRRRHREPFVAGDGNVSRNALCESGCREINCPRALKIRSQAGQPFAGRRSRRSKVALVRYGRLIVLALLVPIFPNPAFCQEQLSRSQMEQDLKELIAVTRRAYAYVDEKKKQYGVDLDSVQASALQSLDGVESNADFCDVLKQVVASLRDGHCEIAAGNIQAPLPWAWPVTLLDVKEGVIVLGVRDELGADSGIARGDIVEEVNGRAIEEWVYDTSRRVSASTDGARRRLALDRMRLTAEREVAVKLQRPTGEVATVTLPTLASENNPPSADFIEARLVSEDVGYLRLPSFANVGPAWQTASTDAERDKALEPVRNQIDAAFALVAATKAIILDLRGNLGGLDLLGEYVISHFLPDDFVYYHSQTRVSPELLKLPGFEYLRGQSGWGEKFTSRPRSTVFTFFRGKTYPGRVVVMTDEGCFSVTDCVAACLADLYPDVRFVGRPTHGGSGGPTRLAQLEHSQADLWLCSMKIWSPKGRLIEGQGTRPDVMVQWTRRDVLDRTDPDFAAALNEARQAANRNADVLKLLGCIAVISAILVCVVMLIRRRAVTAAIRRDS